MSRNLIINLKKYFLVYTLGPLLVIALIASFYRFMILNDYLVSYEIDCDPVTSSCFIGCQDDSCSEVYYYQLVTRKANTIEDLCGPDLTDCEAANYCQTDETECSVIECNSRTDECSSVINDTNNKTSSL